MAAKMRASTATTSGIDRGRAQVARRLHGADLFGRSHDPHALLSGLKREFVFPPFTLLNAREGLWQARKRRWLALGIESELGRGENILGNTSDTAYAKKAAKYRRTAPGGRAFVAPVKKKGKDGKVGWLRDTRAGAYVTEAEYNPKRARSVHGEGENSIAKNIDAYRDGYNAKKARTFDGEGPGKYGDAPKEMTGVSVFDPVLCELAYRWFCPPGGQVLDPFAGGSVRGVVASVLGRNYFGVDLSARQIEANRAQAEKICTGCPMPQWEVGDSTDVREIVRRGFRADLLFSCPPYADLEVYSNDPADISNMDYPAFRMAYRKIIRRSASLLRDDRFAVWMVGEVRDKNSPAGAYHGFINDTIEAFRDAGLAYYNEAILVTATGSLPLRTRKAFHVSRKLGKTHQQVLVFVKGDPRKAAFPLSEKQ